jgi:AcrR family transcriptional regulator
MKTDIFAKIDFNSLVQDKKKSSRRLLQITEGAIDLIYKGGLESFSFEKLSKKCDIARSLIYHYFPDLNELLIFASSLIRYKHQIFVIDKMQGKTNVIDILRSYIQANLLWIDSSPKDAAIWLIYYHKCAQSSPLANHHSTLVDMGLTRIQSILKTGVEQKVLILSEPDIPIVARGIQVLITGAFVSRASELRSPEEKQKELDGLADYCLRMACAVQS